MKTYGYIRVSSKDQNLLRQMRAMRRASVKEENIFTDRESGKDFDRPSYQRMLKQLRQGDLLIIKSIDRLGRNYEDIMVQWKKITREIGADIQVLDMPLLDTNAGIRDLTGLFISDMVLQILAYVAETERSFIRQRQKEGIQAAKEAGVQFGRKRITVPDSFAEYYAQWKNGALSVRQAATMLHMSPATFYRRCREQSNTESNACFKK